MILKTAFIISLLLCVPVLTPAQVYPSPEGELESKYDRFTDQRKIGLYYLQIAEKNRNNDLNPLTLYISLAAVYRSGVKPEPPAFVTVLFEGWTLWDYEFSQPVALDAIIDGKRKSYGFVPVLRNTVVNGKYVSTVGGNMAYSDFQELLKAKTVEMRVGEIELQLTDKMQTRLRDFASMITP